MFRPCNPLHRVSPAELWDGIQDAAHAHFLETGKRMLRAELDWPVLAEVFPVVNYETFTALVLWVISIELGLRPRPEEVWNHGAVMAWANAIGASVLAADDGSGVMVLFPAEVPTTRDE